MTGKPVVQDVVLRSIMSGANLEVFSNVGAFKEHHLRVLVTMPRTPLNVIKMVAQEPGTSPEKAIDYCSSGAMAKVLIKICRDVSCFSFYNQETFVNGTSLHDHRKGADRFRSREVVFEVLFERVMFGGNVLPPHVARWFDNYGINSLHGFMMNRKLHHMLACYDTYEKQAIEATEELVTPLAYQFTIAYHRYIKYLPLIMFCRVVQKKKGEWQATMNDKINKGYSVEQVQTCLVEEEVMHMANSKSSAESKKKKRRFHRAYKSPAIAGMWILTNRVFDLGCCQELILSFL